MPVDRLVTVEIQEPGDYNQAGQFVEGTKTLYRRWATLVDTTVDRTLRLGEGGSRAEESALYRVRYFLDLASANVLTTFLIEADGDRYTITNISEATGRDGNTRRRWLELDCLRADED